jgi:hypothetical protein
VKLAAARGLADLGERQALPVLVALLESENPRVRQYSHETLRALSPQPIAFASEAPLEERAKTVAQWKEWLDKEGEKATLKTPLPDLALRLGRILIASQQGAVIELDANFKVRSTIQIRSPWGVWGLPNGNRLVAVYSQNKVIEYNEAGREVWSKDKLPGLPYSVQRLENGNTLIACADVNQLVEISPDGTTKTIGGSWTQNARPVFARRLENGHTLVALQNHRKVVEIDDAGSVVLDIPDVNGPSSCTRLENGNTLIVQMYNPQDQVIEVDAKGKRTAWSVKITLRNPTDAQRLPSGNTLITDLMGLHEVDPAGNLVREHRYPNLTGLSSY